MSEKRTSTESSHDEQMTKDSGGELTQDPSELPHHDDGDEMSKKRTSTESSHDEQTTKDSDGELIQDSIKLPPYDDDEMSKKQTSTESSHDDQQASKDSGRELTQDPSELPHYEDDNDDEMSKKRTSTESSNDEQTTNLKDSDGELIQDPSGLPPYDDDDDDNDDDRSKKRTSTESSHDEQTTKESDGELTQAVLQNEEDNTKRAILTFLSDTTLDDLPMELIVYVLVKAVAMEVKGMRLAKSVWKEKADLVLSRLRTVSLKWSDILAIDFFRIELHRTLDGIAQETLRWEVVLHQPPIQSYIMSLSIMRDELFLLFAHPDGRYTLNVYDRNNVEQPKDVIQIPKYKNLGNMAACSVSNCIYLLNEKKRGLSVIRVWKDENQFEVSTWIERLRLPKSSRYVGSTGLSVSAQGSLILFSKQESPMPTVVGQYDAKGFVQHQIMLSTYTYGPMHVSSAIEKADGNLVVCFSDNESEAKLLEIDTSGNIIRRYQSSQIEAGVECFEDIYGRCLLNYSGRRIELLDSEFNLMDTATLPLLDDGQSLYINCLRYDRDRHEMVGFRHDFGTEICDLLALRFTEQ